MLNLARSSVSGRRGRSPTPAAGDPSAACPAGPTDCPFVDLTLSKDKIKGIFGNNDECDWRYLDPSIGTVGLGTPIIGAEFSGVDLP